MQKALLSCYKEAALITDEMQAYQMNSYVFYYSGLIDICKGSLDKKVAGALLMDLFKVFDCKEHELLIAKLNAYGFSKKAQLIIYNDISGRKQTEKLSGSSSHWHEPSADVPQGSVLAPLLFNLYINDLFSMVTGTAICSFVDDTTILATDSCLDEILERLNTNAFALFK